MAPFQFRNLWGDPDYQSIKSDLVADLYASLPRARTVLPVEAPA